jgi:hypothetical protein
MDSSLIHNPITLILEREPTAAEQPAPVEHSISVAGILALIIL